VTFDLEFLRTLLGFFSIIGATVSGIAALFVDLKDKKTGRITKWGRYAVFGLAISFLIGVSNLWIDYTEKARTTKNAAEETRANSEKTLRLLTDISRTLNPFKDVRVTFEITYPFDDPDLLPYRQRLDKGVRAIIAKNNWPEKTQGISWQTRDENLNITVVRIDDGSPLLPTTTAEYLARMVFYQRGLILLWFKTPVDPETVDGGAEADITMKLGNDQKLILAGYVLKNNIVKFWGENILTESEHWNSSGQIVSLLDLPGSHLIARLEYDEAVTFFENQLFENQPLSRLKLKRISLPETIFLKITVADRRGWTLRDEDFKKYKGSRGTTNFVYLFPKTYEELLRNP